MFPGRVPFSKEESFTPLRAPRTTPVLQSKLSVNAQEFIPQRSERQPLNQQQHVQQHHHHQQQQQQQQNFVPRQQHHQQYQQQSTTHQRYQHQNGYPLQQQQHQHQQSHYQQPQQQQQSQQFPQRMGNHSDVQDRLKIKGQNGGNKASSNNYYSQNRSSRGNQHQYPSTSTSSSLSSSSTSGSTSTSSSNDNRGNDFGSSSPDMQTIALDYLNSVIQCLNRNPGQFDTVATRFLTIFDGMENNQYVLCIAMEDIFKESTQNDNFRYMGAKLYNLLYMLNLKEDSLFLTLLKCKLDDHRREVLDYMHQSEHGKVREATLFLAELYMQLRADDSRIRLLAENIVYSLLQLLECENAQNIRCIGLTLKLAGYDLTNDCPEEIEQVMNALNIINERSPGQYALIANVLALQKDNWGRKLHTSISLNDAPPEPPRSSDEPIFYGPDGRELTAEETDFLAGGACSGAGDSIDDDDEVDLEEFDLEMDEETAKAYKEFCKLNASSS